MPITSIARAACIVTLLAIVLSTPTAEAVKIEIPGVGLGAQPADPINRVDTVAISPDGQTLAFVANLIPGSTTDRLYTIPLAGGAINQVTSSSEVDDVPAFTPDGQTIVYVDSDNGVDKVHRAPAAGGTGVVVDDLPVSFGFRLSPDGQTVVALTRDSGDDVLRSFPLAGGTVNTLSTPAVEGDSDTETFNISPDGSEVFFATDARFDGANESSLFRVPITGGPAVEIPIGGVVRENADIDHVFRSGDLVYFKGDIEVNGENRINTIPLTGGEPEVLEITNLPSGADVDNFIISPDGQTIAFSADLETVNIFELFVVPIEGGEAVKVSDEFTAEAIDLDITGDGVPDISDGEIDSDVLREPLGTAIAWSADSRHIVYLADGEVNDVFEPYLVANPLVSSLPGDANGDGVVDLLDLDILGQNFGVTPATANQGDFNGDGVVDLLDLDILGQNFGAGASTAVPEPTALVLSLGAISYGARRRS